MLDPELLGNLVTAWWADIPESDAVLELADRYLVERLSNSSWYRLTKAGEEELVKHTIAERLAAVVSLVEKGYSNYLLLQELFKSLPKKHFVVYLIHDDDGIRCLANEAFYERGLKYEED